MNTAGLSCSTTPHNEQNVTSAGVDFSSFPSIQKGAKDTVVFIGCYDCDYSRKAYPDILKIVKNKSANFIFAHYPAKGDTTFLEEAGYCVYKEYGDRYWNFNEYLLSADKDYVNTKSNLPEILAKFNFDGKKISECANSKETSDAVQKQTEELNKTNMYGTPTIFINGKAFVGPKPYRVYRSAINKYIFF